MKRMIKQILLGKPIHGTPVKEFKEGCKVIMPFNISYKGWQDAVNKLGYDLLITFFQNKRQLTETEQDLLTQQLSEI